MFSLYHGVPRIYTIGGTGGERSRGHQIKSLVLYQLSYRPVWLLGARGLGSCHLRTTSCAREDCATSRLHVGVPNQHFECTTVIPGFTPQLA